MGRVGLEPTESIDTRFTVWPATNYGLPTHRVPDETRTRNRWNHNLTMLALFLLIPIELRSQWYQRNRTVFTCETQARASSVYRLGKGCHSKLLDSEF